MKNLVKTVKGIPKTIGIGLAGAILYGTVSCATMTPAQKTALWGDALTVLGGMNAAGTKTKGERFANDLLTISGGVVSKQAQMQENLEIAKAGKSEIVINNNPPNYQNQNQNYNSQNNLENKDNGTPNGIFMYKKWIDFNTDGLVNRDELPGLNESVYDLRNLGFLGFSFYSRGDKSYEGKNLSFKIYNMEDGSIIKSFNEKYDNSRLPNFGCESSYFPKSGRYKAVLNAENNKTFSLDFEVIK